MKKVRVAFAEYDDDVNKLVGYKLLSMHLIFDIKMSVKLAVFFILDQRVGVK